MNQISARDFSFYDELGIDTNALRCVMLKTDNPLQTFIDPGEGIDIPEFSWANGVSKNWHLTLRYGFLPNVRQAHVNEVLNKIITPGLIELSHLDVFRNENYECVIVHVDDYGLRYVNAALGVLPNVATYVPYKAHITIGYFPIGWYDKNCNDHTLKNLVRTLGYEYGSMNE